MLRIFVILLSLQMLACLVPDHADAAVKPNANRWAILIGVDRYIEAKDLKYCGADQLALRDHLVSAGFPKEQVFLMHSGATDQRYLPFKLNIEKQLRLILELVEEDDVLVLAFSGHGIHFDATSYLCPTDADLKAPKTLISLAAVYDSLKNCKASLKLLLVDACRSELSVEGQRGLSEGTRQFAQSLENARPPAGVVLLNSCAPGEISWEEKDFGHGVFMNFLLKGLEGQADENKNGKVSVSELAKFTRLNTRAYVARKFGDSQRPYLKAEGDIQSLEFDISPFVQKTFTNSVGMKLVQIPSGEFLMGSLKTEVGRELDEQQHRVQISRSFYLASTEVTQGQWQAVMRTRPWRGQKYVREGTDHAVTWVSWNEATLYCRRLSAKEGRKYRLPTEAEWEFACRAGSTASYSYGNGTFALKDYGWFFQNAMNIGQSYAHKVGQKRANTWGLYDMHGNVWERCSDWYAADYFTRSPVVNPRGPSSGKYRVLKGGVWNKDATHSRSANRDTCIPQIRSYTLGFRVACDLK